MANSGRRGGEHKFFHYFSYSKRLKYTNPHITNLCLYRIHSWGTFGITCDTAPSWCTRSHESWNRSRINPTSFGSVCRALWIWMPRQLESSWPPLCPGVESNHWFLFVSGNFGSWKCSHDFVVDLSTCLIGLRLGFEVSIQKIPYLAHSSFDPPQWNLGCSWIGSGHSTWH